MKEISLSKIMEILNSHNTWKVKAALLRDHGVSEEQIKVLVKEDDPADTPDR
jgi:osmotically-inducible protein OsmY